MRRSRPAASRPSDGSCGNESDLFGDMGFIDKSSIEIYILKEK